MAPRRLIDPEYKAEVRDQYKLATTATERAKIIKTACKVTGYTYGGLMRALELHIRKRTLSQKETTRLDYFNTLGKLVWDYQQEFSKMRRVSTTMAIKRLKETGALSEDVTYDQISKSIRRQRFKNLSGSYFTPFERSEPLEMIQLDFTRSIHFEHLRKDGKSLLKLTDLKGANAKQSRVWIAVAIDDATRVAYARYYLATGESSLLARDFLLRAARAKTKTDTTTGEIKALPLLQGQPQAVYTDRGKAFKSKAFGNGLLKLGIRHILGSTVTDTLGNKGKASNKQARGKVERMIRFLKNDFEQELFLKFEAELGKRHGVGTTFTLKQVNRLLRQWLVKINNSAHPDQKDSKRWKLFTPVLETAIYPPKGAEVVFSTTVWRKVMGRQVRIEANRYCKVPPEINSRKMIEIIIIGNDYYTMIGDRRVCLEPITPRKRVQGLHARIESKLEDYLEGLALRTKLNQEIEARTRGEMNLGTFLEEYPEVSKFLEDKRSLRQVNSIITHLLIKWETRGTETIEAFVS